MFSWNGSIKHMQVNLNWKVPVCIGFVTGKIYLRWFQFIHGFLWRNTCVSYPQALIKLPLSCTVCWTSTAWSIIREKEATFLDFHLDVAEQLIGSHTLYNWSAYPSWLNSMTHPWLNVILGHQLIQDKKMKCMVCNSRQVQALDTNAISNISTMIFLCIQTVVGSSYHTTNEYWA